MKKIFTFIGVIIFCLPAFTQQNTGNIKGTVTDPAQKPIEKATVQLLKPENKLLVKTVLTDKTGAFELEQISSGKYIVSITAVGFASKSTTVELTLEKTHLQLPALQPSAATKN